MPDNATLRALAQRVGAFHIADRAMKDAQRAVEAALDQDRVDDRARRTYYAAVRQYFASFEREAREHLRDVDRRLERVNQIQFNLVAERGVAVKRIEATQAVLSALAGMQDGAG
jgi:hypothetical protein